MARENQGLQIALIVFVMLTIILGVTTYLFFRQYEESDIKAKSNLAERDKSNKLAQKNEDDVKELKRLIFGAANTEKVETITTTTFNDDMKKYGSSYSEEARFYRPLLEKMLKTIDERNGDLDIAKAKMAKLETDFATREANKQPQIDEFKKTADSANKDLTEERAKFKASRDQTTQEQIKLRSDLESARKEAATSLAKIEQRMQEAVTQIQKLRGINKSLSEKQEELTAQKFEVPNGEIRWVNQRTGTAWINLGKADGLLRQITFGVYPADFTDMSAGGKKASIEVTQILGDHLAEARIFDDRLADPLMPGDKIYTPVWIPGERRHFALAGLMDIKGEGKNDIQSVKDVITMNGGVVDCYLDEKGKKVGDMTVNTRYLVLGEAPNEKSQPTMIASLTKMRTDAERLGVQKIQLSDLLQRMGWKNQTPIEHFGRGATPKGFAHKSETGPQKKPNGSSSDVFRTREPPARIPTSAY
jgi:hypothetical protein